MSINLMSILHDFGLPIALVVFFVWQGWRREKRMSARLDAVNDFVRDRLSSVVEDNTLAMKDIASVLKNRPCLMGADLKVKSQQKRKGVPAYGG